MQPGPPPEDLQAILSRFHTWAEKHPPNGNGNGHASPTPGEAIREIPYEEAIRKHRDRQAARSQRRATPSRPRTAPAPESQVSSAPVPCLPQTGDDLPTWAATLPVVPDDEPALELGPSTSADQAPDATHAEALLEALDVVAPAPARSRKPSPARKAALSAPTVPPPEPRTPAAPPLPPLPVQAFVDLPSTSLTPRHRPQRRSASPPPSTTAAVAQAPAVRKSAPAVAPAPSLQTPIPARSAVKPATTANATKPAPLIAKAAPPRAKPATKAAPPLSGPELPAKPVRIAKSGIAKPGILVPPIAVSAKPTPPPPAVRRTIPTPAAKPKPRTAKHPGFHQILADTVRQPSAALAPKRREPDRTRRITTRFSLTEERRVEKHAAELGITVSAYLRRCALSAVAQDSTPDPPTPRMRMQARKSSKQSAAGPLATYTPPPSFLGAWLAMLRNRFLGPPARFSEDA